MMDFKEFVNQMEQDIKKEFAAKETGIDIRQNVIEKLQQEPYTALSVTPEGQNVGMNLNMDQLYDQVQRGRPYENVRDAAVQLIEQQVKQMPQFDLKDFMDYDSAKKLLYVEVVGTERNAEMLAKVPHKEIENLSMVYRLQVDATRDGSASALITNQLLQQYGISQEQLHTDAMENSQLIRPASMRTMAEVMADIMGLPQEALPEDMAPPMYVVSNEMGMNGAAAVFYPEFMENAAKELNSDLFIIPSSRHEVLLIPDNGDMNAEELNEMIMAVNGSEVQPEDQLADTVYHFDAKDRVFEIGDKYEARRDAKDKAKEDPDLRKSVLKDLQDKKQDHDLKPKTNTHHKSVSEPVM